MPYHARPADKRANLESFDRFTGVRNALRAIGKEKDEWAGIPMPLEGEELIVEPSHPLAGVFEAKELVGPSEWRTRNRFWSSKLESDIIVGEHRGRITFQIIPGVHHLRYDLATLGCSDAWGIEQESTALQLLATLVKPHTFKHYLLTGMFLESSPRSHVTYIFRRLRPTVALVVDRKHDDMHILCALCMHPIAYYAGTWAGAMCPTDDVIAHLMLMRGDEPMFWRRANQHPAWHPGAGL